MARRSEDLFDSMSDLITTLAASLLKLKAGGLILIVMLLLAAYLHGFVGLNPLDRVVGLAERILTKQQDGTPQQVVSNLRIGQALAHQTMFDVSLGLTLAVMFAATPVDIIARIRSRSSSDESRAAS